MEEYINSKELLQKAEILYSFVDLFSLYEDTPRDYGTGELFSMIEIHVLNAIYKNPGITLKKLSEYMRRTKGFISRIVTKMEKNGLVVKTQDTTEKKNKPLYVTKTGRFLCVQHDEFDEHMLLKTYNYLLRDCTPEEISSFYKVMQVYINIMNAAAAKRRNLSQENNQPGD